MTAETNDIVRVRFAPSPTGFLHVGGLRTALYNYLFARHHRGKFILRIEDTDQNREVEGAVENLVNSLHWAGLEYDEGPVPGGQEQGELGPYFQSSRLDLYQKYTEQLLDDGHAYHCFCSQQRLEKVRKQQIEQGKQTKYDQHCRKLTMDERQSRLDAGMPYVIRMKIPDDDLQLTFKDAIHGEVSIPYENLDDQIIMKSDGFPTYHLANVVDDHLMRISHVIRGEEWLPSTPKHILLYTYFGWEVPVFAHLPLLLNEDRSKLSKRQGDVAVEDYRQNGYLPEALINFIALLGWNPGDEQEIISLEEMILKFSTDRINTSGAIFNVEKLQWMNGVYIRNTDIEHLVDLSLPVLSEAGFDTGDRDKMKKIIEAVQTNLRYLGEIPEATRVFQSKSLSREDIADPEVLEILEKDSSQTVYKSLMEKLSAIDNLQQGDFRNIMKAVQKETEIKGKDLWMPVRVALTGEMHGPELPAVIEILGRDHCLSRIRDQVR